MRPQRHKKKSHNTKTRYIRLLIFAAAIATGLLGGVALYFYDELLRSNVEAPGEAYLYIPTGSSRDDVVLQLEQCGWIKDMSSLRKAIARMKYHKIYAGKFKLTTGLNNREIVRTLAGNLQTPVDLVISPSRTRERLAGNIAGQIELDSLTILQAMTDNTTAHSYGFTTEHFACMFMPNTYQVYWNISLTTFLNRLFKEWNAFWATREDKLKEVQLTKEQVVVLASIVSEETAKFEEMPTIAGVYINRLRKGMFLQADPTARYAAGNSGIRRVLLAHIKIQHPYNTYVVYGLPPGPIAFPTPRHIDAVLNYERHAYLYFCAKDDFSGYHNFAQNYNQHIINARNYQRALSRRAIFK